MAAIETVEVVHGKGSPLGSVIWLHGLGADGHDFEPIVAELRLPADLSLRFVFPHAPLRPVTINGGMSMRAWYDILSLERGGPSDDDGIRASAAILDELIAREIQRGIAAHRIVVAGFSQGGAIALHAGLRCKVRLAGIMALSSYLPISASFQREVVEASDGGHRDVPVFMAHGSLDPMLPMALGRDSAKLLIANGFKVEWHDYPMAHSVCLEEIGDIRRWLLSIYAVE
ncbi:MAG: alpha/beta hydrolase [Gammaproteobacteria bacterium]|nr:alpha/beta hydrolase [Gammaproteobacteria bacterium]MDH5303154.1 alpha/beta hydrolase [Gammaproteobacteria bacterium]MDH5320838.1 alpha/beta hydrolase [Gammaproteobacteria bacterium]